MDNPRLYLWIGLALLGWMNVVTWNRDYGSPPVATSVATDPAAAGAQSAEQAAAAAATAAANAQLPALPTGQPTTEAAATTDPTVPAAAVATGQPSIRIVTDVLDLDISLQGGDFVRADLLQYPRDKRPGSPPVRLFGTQEPDYSVARTGLRALNGRPEPTHLATFTSTANEFRLAPGATELRVPLSWNDGLGVTVTKTYVFRPGSYAIEVLYDVDNRSESEWSGASYVQLARHVYAQERSMFDVESYAYRGPAVWDGSKYRKLDVDDEEDGRYAQNVTDGWMATMQHHFVSAAVPPKGEEYHVTLAREGSHALLTHRGPLKTVPAGTTGRFSETIFVGPKLQDQLKEVGPRLELTADYGKLTILSQPLFWLLQKVHGFVGNWGWSIIIVTILLKLLFYKRSFDGQDAHDRAAHQEHPGAVQGRPRAARQADDGDLQAREDQPGRRLPADPGADPRVPRVLLGAARERRDAPGAVDAVDPGPLVERPVLRAADPDGRGDVRAVQAEPGAARSDAGEDLRVHAGDHDGDDGVVPVRPRAVLAHEHAALDRTAVEHQPRGRGGGEEAVRLRRRSPPSRPRELALQNLLDALIFA